MQSPTSTEIVLMMKESLYKAGIVAEPELLWILIYSIRMHQIIILMLCLQDGEVAQLIQIQCNYGIHPSWVNKGSNFCGFGDAESDALIEEANNTLRL